MANPKEPLIEAAEAIGDDTRERVPFAGLLAHKPVLRTELHTRTEWQQLLQAYLYPGEETDAG
jgi:hypothetical protein